ncbi:uncharacterized protein BT62DRAFT_930973 [Guyanagaster necrorhizus]|uniref:Uncharacterized protein n=1 Tax=Guyanagaster necrorhizus TaxID=856835 RepID=A0A9P7VUK0_9AGAR|nr:uncharacterized protein BT62DRAFT_930973 [Guyanagaster necrorhizus MCA 3950]KAG7447137.1 hypothetical protein BT62DRAFT_930973 [Guyanagaster necrorhizus MCA 3950]
MNGEYDGLVGGVWLWSSTVAACIGYLLRHQDSFRDDQRSKAQAGDAYRPAMVLPCNLDVFTLRRGDAIKN